MLICILEGTFIVEKKDVLQEPEPIRKCFRGHIETKNHKKIPSHQVCTTITIARVWRTFQYEEQVGMNYVAPDQHIGDNSSEASLVVTHVW